MKNYFLKNIFVTFVFFQMGCSGGSGGGSENASLPAPPSLTTCQDSNASNKNNPLPCNCNTGYATSLDGTSCLQSSAITTCQDSNASNLNSTLPCSCSSGYTVSLDGKTCDSNSSESFTYTPVFSSYLPLQADTTPCTGIITTSRIMTCQRSDLAIVDNSFCSPDSNPNSTVQSKAGKITVSSTNPSLANGVESKTCTVGQSSGTSAITCDNGFHLSGATLATSNCYLDTISCAVMPTGALSASQVWNGSSYGSCTVNTCNSFANYVKTGNTCTLCPLNQEPVSVSTCAANLKNKKLYDFGGSKFHIMQNNSVRAWGFNGYGALGVGDTSVKLVSSKVSFPGGFPLNIFQSLQSKSMYAVNSNNNLVAWGQNDYGQLGLGAVSNIFSPTVVNLGTGRKVRKFIVGFDNACAILDDQSLSCWGKNDFGQLGLGTNLDYNTPQPVNVGSGRTVVDVVMMKNMVCIITDDSSAKCSGYNLNGQLGDGTTISKNLFTKIYNSSAKKIISFGSDLNISICILKPALYCWGDNTGGRLGLGDTLYKTLPEAVDMGSGVSLVSLHPATDGTYVCAIVTGQKLKCWGKIAGDSVETKKPKLINFFGTNKNVKTYANYGKSSYVILDDNTGYSWGENSYGQLASISATGSIDLSGTDATGIKTIHPGPAKTCIISTLGAPSCAGYNTIGQLGAGFISLTESLLRYIYWFPSDRPVVEMEALGNSSCVLLDNDTVKCWGSNASGNLGNGNTIDQKSPGLVL